MFRVLELDGWGTRELAEAFALWGAWSSSPYYDSCDQVRLCFNAEYGTVFLDVDGYTFVLEDVPARGEGKPTATPLRYCHECGFESRDTELLDDDYSMIVHARECIGGIEALMNGPDILCPTCGSVIMLDSEFVAHDCCQDLRERILAVGDPE